jgi:hypothetical protein
VDITIILLKAFSILGILELGPRTRETFHIDSNLWMPKILLEGDNPLRNLEFGRQVEKSQIRKS